MYSLGMREITESAAAVREGMEGGGGAWQRRVFKEPETGGLDYILQKVFGEDSIHLEDMADAPISTRIKFGDRLSARLKELFDDGEELDPYRIDASTRHKVKHASEGDVARVAVETADGRQIDLDIKFVENVDSGYDVDFDRNFTDLVVDLAD